jgi:hypothetical protein
MTTIMGSEQGERESACSVKRERRLSALIMEYSREGTNAKGAGRGRRQARETFVGEDKLGRDYIYVSELT